MATAKTRPVEAPLAALVGRPSISATAAKNAFGRVLDLALSKGVVTITKRDRPRAVVMSIDEFESLVGAKRARLDTLSSEFDMLLGRMQTPSARRATRAAFAATPDELGRAAVAAVRRTRG